MPSSTEVCAGVVNGSSCHALHHSDYACGRTCGVCAPLPPDHGACSRPCGSFTLKLRGTGGKFIRESVMLALFPKEAVTQSEGRTLAHPATASRLQAFAAGGAATVVVLRDPLQRILSRFWHEGRPTSSHPHSSGALEAWLDEVAVKARKASPSSTMVWQHNENYYVKTLAGCGGHVFRNCTVSGLEVATLQRSSAFLSSFRQAEGRTSSRTTTTTTTTRASASSSTTTTTTVRMPWRDRGAAGRLSSQDAGCVRPTTPGLSLGRDHLYEAERALRDRFSLVLVTEWLDTAGSGLLLAKALCFEWPRKGQLVPRGAGAGKWMEVPDLAPKRYSSRRGDPPVGWLASVRDDYASRRRDPREEEEEEEEEEAEGEEGAEDAVSAAIVDRLRRENSLDRELFAWTAALVRRRIRRVAEAANMPEAATTLPNLPLERVFGRIYSDDDDDDDDDDDVNDKGSGGGGNAADKGTGSGGGRA